MNQEAIKLIKLLESKNLKLSCAESCTGGLISKLITDVPGSSNVFLGSVCSYSNKVKENLLNVKHETLQEYGAVSKETAEQMANGVLNLIGSDIAISTTGIAGPGGATSTKPVGLVYISVATKDKLKTICLNENPKFSREQIRNITAEKALNLANEVAEELDNIN